MNKQVLEIVENGGSQLKSVLGDKTGYEYNTYRMKSFVALREELDGKYDFIYIGSGNFTPEKVGNYTDRSLAHNTTNKQNDITKLKALEIINDFVEKNQLVILHTDILRTSSSELFKHFGRYLLQPRSNVRFVSSVNSVPNVVNQYYNNHTTRPRFEILQQPAAYPGGKEYQAHENITFTMNVHRQTASEVTANLYIDANFNHRFEPNELVQSVNVAGNNTSLEYRLPRGHSGLRYWKLEIVDRNTGLKDYQTGVFKFKGEKVNIKVLQVTSGENDGSRLTLSNNMNQSFLSTNDYHIHIDTVSMRNFTDSSHQFSHTKLNGRYDMLIFGFNDSYNERATLTQNAANSVQSFINTKQSVMFTHDTIFNQNNVWVKNFMDATGQGDPWTNLGFGAPQQSQNTKKVNEGLLTQFPFPLGTNIRIANTHNQYYTLDLEDHDVIPWYNITGGHRDNDDSWNHYYTYSKGNITYSGTGHTNNGFPVEEQKLFVNTMFRAFLGSNTAPIINVLSPSNERNHLSSQDLELVYEAYDLDLTDRQLKTRVYLNNSRQPIYTNNDVANGAIVRYTIGHQHLNKGKTTIRIEVEDATGAIAMRERIVNVQEAELNVTKTLSKNKAFIDDEVTVSYAISLNNASGLISNSKAQHGKVFPYAVAKEHLSDPEILLADGNEQGNYGWIESNDGSGASRLAAMILADEKLDVVVNQTVTTEPGNMNMTETVKRWLNKQTKVVYLPIVADYPNGRKDIPVKEIGIFEMYEKSNGKVYLRFTDYLTEMDTIILSNIKIQDFLPKGVELVEDKTNVVIHKRLTSSGTTLEVPLKNISLKQLFNEPLVVQYTIKSKDPGIYVMDQSLLQYQLGNSPQSSLPFNGVTLEIVRPVTGVQMRSTTSDIIIGETPIRLFFDIIPDNATNKGEAINSAIWTSSDPSVISVDKNGFITGHKKGNATITISVNDVDGVNQGIPFTHSRTIEAIHPLDKIEIQGSSGLFVNEQETYSIRTTPLGVEVGTVQWSIKQGQDLIDLNNTGRVVAKKPGTAIIRAEVVFRGERFIAERLITIKELVIDPTEVEIAIGSTQDLQARLYDSTTTFSLKTNETSWTSSNPNVATVNDNGRVEGLREGTATITAKFVENNKERTATAVVIVKKVPLAGIDAGDKIYVEKGKSKDIQLTFTPRNATNKRVSFRSNRPGYATVDDNGRVTGVEVRYDNVNGELVVVPAATIIITSEDDQSIWTSVEIIVIEPGSSPGGDNGSTIGSDRW